MQNFTAGRTRLTVIAALALALSIAAVSVCRAADEFAPTGDALWDAYASALLEELPNVDSSQAPFSVMIPDTTLAGWEGQFAADPRYWQMRYWNAMADDENPDAEARAVGFLREGRKLGAEDASTIWLLYEQDRRELDDLWDRFTSDEATEGDKKLLPEFSPSDTPSNWYDQQRLTLADDLVARLPDESAAWYARAQFRMEFANWDGALADLRTGNAALHNRVLLPFPWSYVTASMSGAVPVGSTVAAGIVANQSMLAIPFPNYIRIKDHFKEEEIRFAMGAPLGESEALYKYACRYGAMENAPAIQWLVAAVLCNMVTHYCLIETPESFDIDQREDLWILHFRVRDVRDLVRYELHDDDEIQQLMDRMSAVMLDSGIQPGTVETAFDRGANTAEVDPQVDAGETASVLDPYAELLAQMPVDQQRQVMHRINVEFFNWTYGRLQKEYGDVAAKARQKFDRAAEFDFTTWSFPPEPEPLPEATTVPE